MILELCSSQIWYFEILSFITVLDGFIVISSWMIKGRDQKSWTEPQLDQEGPWHPTSIFFFLIKIFFFTLYA